MGQPEWADSINQEQHRLHKPGVAGSSPAAAIGEAVISHCPAEEYHSWPQTSCSQLKELASSPLGFYLRYVSKEAPPKSGDALAYGSLLHLWAELLHQGDESAFWDRVAVAASDTVTATGQLGKAAEAWKKKLPPDAIPLAPVTRDQLWSQTRQILHNDAAAELLADSVDKEFNIVWSWQGHDCRCRVDGATASCFYDLKTTREKDPLADFWRAVDDWGYDLQSAMYEVAAVAAGWPAHRMRFIVTSTVWPHHCEVVTLPDGVVRRGRSRCLALLAELQQRREWDSWFPAGYGKVHELKCPKFMYERDY